ncbi:MAG: hypothetical protein H6739_11595 [Alphaproteobacteria bacterium]|nr:hypothetical protein [Alphaproteobacteria bacterium]
MNDGPDLYTPWREDQAQVKRRHVGRASEMDALRGAIRDFAEGGAPLPIYLFGPRGVGKSHVLTLIATELRPLLKAKGVPLIIVPEDIPLMRDAGEVLSRMEPEMQTPGWMRWDQPRHRAPDPPESRRVVLFEGLDRQFNALHRQERRALRRALDDGKTYLVGTGVSLGSAFTGREEAFFGAFDPWPLDGLDDQLSGTLLDRVVAGTPVTKQPHWAARREALVTLSGGSARALIALGAACVASPEVWATDALYAVVRQFTAHYQMRFRDLSSWGQKIVEVLAEAPRELTPTDLSELLNAGAAHMAVQCGRMEDDGVLLRRAKGRHTWYRIAEPLFRYWLEYRTALWNQTRIGWLGKLLESILSPAEVATAWWRNPDGELRSVAAGVLEKSEEGRSEAWQLVYLDLIAAVRDRNEPRIREIVERTKELPTDDYAQLNIVLILQDLPQFLLPIRVDLRACGFTHIALALDFLEAIDLLGVPPRKAFSRLLKSIKKLKIVRGGDYLRFLMAEAIISLVLRRTKHRGPAWRLSTAERGSLARIPFLRCEGLRQGRRPGDPPLLEADDCSVLSNSDLEEDGELLLLAAKHIRDPMLFGRVAGLELDPRFLLTFQPVPHPELPVPAAADKIIALAQRIWAMGASPLEWAATFADADVDHWRALLTTLADKASDQRTHWVRDTNATITALASLAIRAPERFAELSDALGENWSDLTGQAGAIAAQLRDPQSRLHPELARLRQTLLGEAT